MENEHSFISVVIQQQQSPIQCEFSDSYVSTFLSYFSVAVISHHDEGNL